MPTETINGSNAAVQNREVITFTPNVGGEYGGKYEGPYLKVKEKMQELIQAGFAVQYECDQSPVATLTFKTPSNGSGNAPVTPNADYVDNFQVLRNTTQKELLSSEHPLLAGLSIENLQQLKSLINNPDPITYDAYRVSTKITGVRTVSGHSPTSSATKAQYLLDLWLSGVRSVEVKQPVLRVTRVTNPLYDVPFDLTYVDRILTTPTMISDSGVPSNFAIGLVELANALSARTTLVSGDTYAFREDYVASKFGWLKDAITSETVGTTKNQYVLEYKFGLYDVATYGEPV